MISARNLRLTLGDGPAAVEILRGIDLDVAPGETLALLGPSGSGKSSLMAVLTGLERATSGTLTVAGADFETLDEDALARARRWSSPTSRPATSTRRPAKRSPTFCSNGARKPERHSS